MKINFKKGIRRIALSFIGLCVIISLFTYVLSGCIWDNNRFIDNTYVYRPNNPNNTILFRDFVNRYLKTDDNYYWNYIFYCHPYKQFCEFENNEYYANKDYKFTIYNINHYSNESLLKFKKTGQYVKADIKLKMPSRIQYFSWQLFDFILIFIIASFIYGIYLGIEFIICWIIKGFKND